MKSVADDGFTTTDLTQNPGGAGGACVTVFSEPPHAPTTTMAASNGCFIAAPYGFFSVACCVVLFTTWLDPASLMRTRKAVVPFANTRDPEAVRASVFHRRLCVLTCGTGAGIVDDATTVSPPARTITSSAVCDPPENEPAIASTWTTPARESRFAGFPLET